MDEIAPTAPQTFKPEAAPISESALDSLLDRAEAKKRERLIAERGLLPDSEAGVYIVLEPAAFGASFHTDLSRPLPGWPYVEVRGQVTVYPGQSVELLGGDNVTAAFMLRVRKAEAGEAPITIQELIREAGPRKRAADYAAVVTGQEKRMRETEAKMLELQVQLAEQEQVLKGFVANAKRAGLALMTFYASRGEDPEAVAAAFRQAAAFRAPQVKASNGSGFDSFGGAWRKS
jgi:hypothetical protein